LLLKIIWLAIAGACGTVTRYSLNAFVQRFQISQIPLGTLSVNILGCFLVGIIFSIFESRFSHLSELKIIIITGFIGAFTTFSAVILETGTLIQLNRWFTAFSTIFLHNFLGLLALFCGIKLGKF